LAQLPFGRQAICDVENNAKHSGDVSGGVPQRQLAAQ
jgi:hypothetical protein